MLDLPALAVYGRRVPRIIAAHCALQQGMVPERAHRFSEPFDADRCEFPGGSVIEVLVAGGAPSREIMISDELFFTFQAKPRRLRERWRLHTTRFDPKAASRPACIRTSVPPVLPPSKA